MTFSKRQLAFARQLLEVPPYILVLAVGVVAIGAGLAGLIAPWVSP